MLYDNEGDRKYLTQQERTAFIRAARLAGSESETFCLVLAYTGARISEVLNLTPKRVDFSVGGLVFESLKKRRAGIFRVVPIPDWLLERLDDVHHIKDRQPNSVSAAEALWPWCRTTGWTRVKSTMQQAGITGPWATPKALRHGFGIECATEAQIPINIVQRWLGHSRIQTTTVYLDAVGAEERRLASRLWSISDTG